MQHHHHHQLALYGLAASSAISVPFASSLRANARAILGLIARSYAVSATAFIIAIGYYSIMKLDASLCQVFLISTVTTMIEIHFHILL